MGKRGPKPTPSGILEARGSWRGKLNRDEPAFEAKPPKCPDWISESGKAYFKIIVKMMRAANILRNVDEFALTRYVTLLARWRTCEEFIIKHGDTYPVKDDQGVVIAVKEFPQVRRATDLCAQLTRLEAEFGMTPSSRSRIVAGAPAPAKPVARPASDAPPALRIAQ